MMKPILFALSEQLRETRDLLGPQLDRADRTGIDEGRTDAGGEEEKENREGEGKKGIEREREINV